MDENLDKLLKSMQLMSVPEVEKLEAQLQASRIIYIIAPNFGLADRYAAKHKIARKQWRYIHRENELFPLAGDYVLCLSHDQYGSLEFSRMQREMIRLARDLADDKRFTFRDVALEMPPYAGGS